MCAEMNSIARKPNDELFESLPHSKVVHLTSVHSVFDTRIFQKECVSLAENGFEVSIVGPRSREEQVSVVQIIPVESSTNRFLRVFMVSRAVVLRAVQENADIYHLHDPELLLWAHILKRTGAIVVFDMHEDLPLQVRNKIWIPKLFRPLLSFFLTHLEKILLRGIPVVLAEMSYKGTRSWIRKSVDILNFPKIDWLTEMKCESQTGSVPRIGYIGAVTKERGSTRMVKALGELRRRGLDVEFDCIGPIIGEHREFLLNLAGKMEVDGAQFPGYLHPEAGWARIAKCKIGMAVLEPIPNYLESYPTKMFEYMGLGLPVIVSNFPLYREIIDRFHCGFAVDPLDTHAVADAVQKLLDDPAEAEAMGERGREAALQEFDWRGEEAKLVKFYEELLSWNKRSSEN